MYHRLIVLIPEVGGLCLNAGLTRFNRPDALHLNCEAESRLGTPAVRGEPCLIASAGWAGMLDSVSSSHSAVQ